MKKALKTWWVEMPPHQYEEDIKQLAKDNGLKIVDIRYKGSNRQVSNPPEITKKDKR